MPDLPPSLWLLIKALAVLLVTGMAAHLLIYRRLGRRRKPPAPSAPAGPPAVMGGGEKRSSLRREGQTVVVTVADAEGRELTKGWVVDRSTGGLGICLSIPLEVGTHIKVRPGYTPGVDDWVDVIVCRCQPDDDIWRLGCEFTVTPPWNILLRFG